MSAKIFNIQSFSTTDGPGIRTVVFFQACNLKCAWCHNPESQPSDAPDAFLPEKCIGCEACRKGGECYAGARTKTVRDFNSPEQLWKLLAVDVPYLKNSGGGITFSGGECMLQVDFLEEIIKLCREKGVHTAVDTAGHIPYDWLMRANPDLFLYDIKAFTAEKYMELCGVDGFLIWENLRKLVKDGRKVIVRVPCVPGANWEEMADIAKALNELKVEVELLAYHRLGEGKAAWFGKEIKIYENPKEEEMKELWKLFNYQKK